MQRLSFGERRLQAELQFVSDFQSLEDFWCEGTPDVRAAGGSLIVRATLEREPQFHFVSSVFCRQRFYGNLLIEFDARSIHPQSQRNFNFFIHADAGGGRDLFQTRGDRTGDYPEYHSMPNYLFTYVPGRVQSEGEAAPEVARWRFRRNPGFQLMKEVHAGKVEQQRWYYFQYLVHDGLIACAVDRDPLETYGWRDPEPLREGYFGFRTFCSHMEYRALKVWKIN